MTDKEKAMADWYTLDPDGTPRPIDHDKLKTADAMATATQMKTEFPDGTVISTVFLMLDHRMHPNGEPVLWETTVSDSPHINWDDRIQRYATLENAVAEHNDLVARYHQERRSEFRSFGCPEPYLLQDVLDRIPGADAGERDVREVSPGDGVPSGFRRLRTDPGGFFGPSGSAQATEAATDPGGNVNPTIPDREPEAPRQDHQPHATLTPERIRSSEVSDIIGRYLRSKGIPEGIKLEHGERGSSETPQEYFRLVHPESGWSQILSIDPIYTSPNEQHAHRVRHLKKWLQECAITKPWEDVR